MRLAKLKDWKYYYWLIGLISGMGILIEKKPRRSELALYVRFKIIMNMNLLIILPYLGAAESSSSPLSFIVKSEPDDKNPTWGIFIIFIFNISVNELLSKITGSHDSTCFKNISKIFIINLNF